jgi:hypothetical protein
MKKIILSMLMLFLSAGMLSAQNLKIAILDFKNTGLTAAEYSDISDHLRKELINKKNAVVMNRDVMLKYFAAEKYNASGCLDNDCASESASILKADIIIFGVILKNEKKYSITLGVYNAKSRDKSFKDRFETASITDLKKNISQISEKIAPSFPKSDFKNDEKISWELDQKEKEERKYGLKYNFAIDTSYLIMLVPLYYINGTTAVSYDANPFLVGLKFQVELFDLMKFGIIGEFAFPLTPKPVGSSPYLGSGGAIISFTTSVYKKTLFFMVDLAFLGGVYSYSSNSATNFSFFNMSPRLTLQYFPVTIFGLELSVGYNYYISSPKIPDAVTVGLNFIFRL